MEKRKKPNPRPPQGTSWHLHPHPFLPRRCDYCDFYSVGRSRGPDGQLSEGTAGPHQRDRLPWPRGSRWTRSISAAVPPASLGISGCGNCWEPFKSVPAYPGRGDHSGGQSGQRGCPGPAPPPQGRLQPTFLRDASACPAELESVHRPHTVQQVDQAVAAA